MIAAMSIYVDRLENWGWRLRGHTVASCHLFCDAVDLEELHAFALRIGMRRQWFQPHRIAPHYDLTESRRIMAVSLGAIELDRKGASAVWRARRAAVAALAADTVVVDPVHARPGLRG